MKCYYGVMLVALAALLTFWPAQQARAQAGDTLLVEWETTPGSEAPVVNALRTAIANDTNRPAGRVYLLKRGGFYWITDPIENSDFPLNIVGQTEAALQPGEFDYGPAVIQRYQRDDGSAPDGTMFRSNDDLTLKNVWIMGRTSLGRVADYEPIKLLGDDKNYVFDNVIFDRNDWHHLGPDGPNSDFWITNCSFRNIFGPTQIWEGLGIRFEVGADTVVIENNTFFNIGFTPFQSEAAPVNYLRFNHNTLLNIGRSFQAGALWKECYVANNVFVNYFWQGESEPQYTDPGRVDFPGFFGIGTLPPRYGTNFDRQVLLANNSYWRDPRFDAFDASQTPPILPQPLISDTTQGWFDAWEGMVIQNNWNEKTNINTYITDDIIDRMFQFISDMYADPIVTNNPDARYYWDPGRDEQNFVNSIWPLPEDFSYSTPAPHLTAGTDGLPLGDLNWFPAAKATFEANKDQFVADIESMTTAPVLDIVETVEAEEITLGGDATIFKVEGFTFFIMDGSGSIEWTFDLPTGGQYDLNVWTHMRGNNTRGQHTYINGVEIHDTAFRYGELIYSTEPGPSGPNPHQGMPINEWTWVRWTQADLVEAGALTFLTGSNTIRITPSWGYQNFAGIDLLEPGTENVVTSLRAPDAVYEGVTPGADASIPWVPNKFKGVTLGAGGSISFSVDGPYDAKYMLRIFYAAAGAQQGQLAVDGNMIIPSIAFNDTADVFTDQFIMSKGTHTIAISSAAGGVTVDYLQVIVFVPTGINAPRELPEGYYLAQNYPNPFNPTTTISFAVGEPSQVKLTVYNLLGQKVVTLIDRRMNAGPHTVEFNASMLTSGVYFYRLEAGEDFILQRKMMLLK